MSVFSVGMGVFIGVFIGGVLKATYTALKTIEEMEQNDLTWR